MLKKPTPATPEKIEQISLDALVPQNHLVRKIAKVIDFEFIREAVAPLYCPNNGRPAEDPVRLFKIMLLGYLFGIPSERRLVQEIQVNLAYRWFLGMGLTEKVIDASTLSQNRRRRFNDSEIYQQIFDNIVEQAIAKGLISGRVLYTDSTHLKANANKGKARNEQRIVEPSQYIDALNQAINAERELNGKKPLKPSTVEKYKEVKVSTTDPDSGFMHREGKPKGFFYLDHRTVDGKHNLITDTYVTAGNIHDSQPYMARLKRQLERFGFNPVGVGLDAGYFTAPICHLLLAKQIYPVLGYRHYHSDATTCKICPLLSQCTQSKNTQKVITRHIWEADKEIANEIRLSQWGKKVYARRKETIERSFADAKQHHGHRYARFRGRAQVQMQCLLAAMAQNIKKIAIKLFLLRFFKLFFNLFNQIQIKKPIYGLNKKINPELYRGLSSI
ncbi:IS1182 family transposase [Gilliamella sp. App6-5]|uniref:IS1182 family transposase n=1 Tax=Gilliamella sp. App6-5 TaxID=3120232 RepID=UPI00210031E5|nr:IS1182 family transposase [Gilliamella apicola]